ncbi:hypothetical protein DW894_09500 [Ruminococcus sp. AM41-10BH]|nr:hypothetical protein DW894_09500 [Ruminococcus sp. AM41-10BH]
MTNGACGYPLTGSYEKTWNFACTCKNRCTHRKMCVNKKFIFAKKRHFRPFWLLKIYKNKHVKMLVLLQRKKNVSKHAQK